MKKTSSLFFIIFLITASIAHADHHAVFINSIIKVSDTDCAVELTITADNQDAFVDADTIKFDSTTVTDFSLLVDAGFNVSTANHNTGDHILAGSHDFQVNHSLTRELFFHDSADCSLLDASTVVGYYTDGTTLIDSIDTATVTGFGNNTAIIKTSASATPTLVNLTSSSVTATNNFDETAVIGTSSGGSTTGGTTASSSGGCSLIP